MGRTIRALLGALSLAVLGIVLEPGVRADEPPTYKVGDRVEADPMLINNWRPATVVKIYLADGRVHGYEVRMDQEGDSQVKEEYTVGTTVARGVRPPSERKPARPAKNREETAEAPRAEATPAPRSDKSPKCSSDATLMAKARPDDSNTLSFERAILGRYEKKVEEKSSLSAPLAVGITFDSFQIGAPRVNERTLDRVDGSYVRSAPVGGSIFPVKTRFTVCEVYRTEITWTSVDGRYECFKDNFGVWACANASGWRTLGTKRELLEGR